MSVLIGADIVPTIENEAAFISGDIEKIIGSELRKVFDASTYKIMNLEVPLTDSVAPIKKNGDNMIAATSTVRGIKSLGVDLLTLANNHIMDQGYDGLKNTIRVLGNAGICYLGVGKNINEAAKPFFFMHSGKKIGVYACVEHEFSIASDEKGGANPFDPLTSLNHIHRMKQNCDFAVILYHGGKEHYRYPSPKLQNVCRKIIESGGDLVICQHTHCIGCEEKYQNGTIVYGQGNFLFGNDYHDSWKTSLLISIDENFSIKYFPIVLSEDGSSVNIASDETAKKILDGFAQRSRKIQEPGFIDEQYNEFAKKMIWSYLWAFGGKESKLFKIINKISGNRFRTFCQKRKYDEKQCLAIRNYIECEAHQELLLRGLRVYNDV